MAAEVLQFFDQDFSGNSNISGKYFFGLTIWDEDLQKTMVFRRSHVLQDPLNETDSSGLAMDCGRPLNFLPGQAGYVSHEFVCYTGQDGTVICGGLGPTTKNPFSSPGQIEPDQPNSSCHDAGKGCMDDCVANQLKNNVPRYRLVGSNCHDYAQTVINTCKAVCGGK